MVSSKTTTARVFKKRHMLADCAGFTLIEVLASILVFSLGILGVFAVAALNLSSMRLIEQNIVASALVQEGIEVTRNIRDRDWFLSNPFGAGLPDGQYRVQWNSDSLIALDPNPDLKKNPTAKIFSYDDPGGLDSGFKRTIGVTRISADEIMVVSTVDWNFKTMSKTISAEIHLYNWW